MTRGHEVIETLLEKNIPFTSGPQWLYENVLRERYVIAVSGTHGKTTTSSMLSWILDDNELNPSLDLIHYRLISKITLMKWLSCHEFRKQQLRISLLIHSHITIADPM